MTSDLELLLLLEREEVDGLDAGLGEAGDQGLVDVSDIRADKGHFAESQVLDRLDRRRQGVRDMSCLAAGVDQFPDPAFESPVLLLTNMYRIRHQFKRFILSPPSLWIPWLG